MMLTYTTLTDQQSMSISTTIIELRRTEGVRYLFKGLLPRLISTCSMMSVFYVLNEELMKFILHKTL